MDISLWSILAHIVNIGIIYVIVRLLLYKPVVRFLNKRRDQIASEHEKLGQDRLSMDQFMADRDHLLEEAKQESLQLSQSNEVRMEKQAQQIIADAQREAGEILRRARQQAEAQRQTDQQQVKTQAVGLGMDIAQRVLQREVKREDHQRMIDDFLGGEVS